MALTTWPYWSEERKRAFSKLRREQEALWKIWREDAEARGVDFSKRYPGRRQPCSQEHRAHLSQSCKRSTLPYIMSVIMVEYWRNWRRTRGIKGDGETPVKR